MENKNIFIYKKLDILTDEFDLILIESGIEYNFYYVDKCKNYNFIIYGIKYRCVINEDCTSNMIIYLINFHNNIFKSNLKELMVYIKGFI